MEEKRLQIFLSHCKQHCETSSEGWLENICNHRWKDIQSAWVNPSLLLSGQQDARNETLLISSVEFFLELQKIHSFMWNPNGFLIGCPVFLWNKHKKTLLEEVSFHHCERWDLWFWRAVYPQLEWIWYCMHAVFLFGAMFSSLRDWKM